MATLARAQRLAWLCFLAAAADKGALRKSNVTEEHVHMTGNSTELALVAEGAHQTRSGANEYYWDGQCSPCPAYLYPAQHCSRGGRVSGERACRTTIAFCEAKCVRTVATPRPVPGPSPSPSPSPGFTYWDGVCLPCPAYFYWRAHCTNGGKLVSARGCGWNNIFCEGQCYKRGAPATTVTTTWVDFTTEGGVKTMYHMTSPSAAEAILASSFRPGSSGWCGGAIYFSPTPNIPDSKLGPDSQRGAIIEAQVDLGTMRHLNSACLNQEEARNCCDSITFNPGDGEEYLVFSADRVISMSRYS